MGGVPPWHAPSLHSSTQELFLAAPYAHQTSSGHGAWHNTQRNAPEAESSRSFLLPQGELTLFF